jgi:Na+/melibiose symporter-like transporter
MSIYPAIFGLIGVILMAFYPIDNKMMKRIEEDLAMRRQKSNV